MFIRTNGARVPWTPVLTGDRAGQATAVAAARALGGWHALPADGSALPAAVIKNAGLAMGFLSLFMGVGVLILLLQVVMLLTWRPVPATVLSTGIEDVRVNRGRMSYRPVVTYRYAIGGRQYTSSGVTPLNESRGYAWAEAVIERYHRGQTITAYVDPQHPDRAFVEHWFALFTVVFILVPLAILLLLGFTSRRRRGTVGVAPPVPVVPAQADPRARLVSSGKLATP